MAEENNYVRITFNIPQDTEDLLTLLYINRLKNKTAKGRISRSALVAEAIKEKFERDIQ